MTATRRQTIAKVASLVCVTVLCLTPSVSGQPRRHTRVLAFYFTRPDAGAFVGIDAALRQALADDLGDRLEYTAEYLDLIRFAEPGFQSAMRAYLRARYADDRFDAIIATSPAVLQFLAQDRSILRDAPIVFMTRPGVAVPANATGIESTVDFKGSLAAALQLQPETTDVFVVSGTSEFDRLYEQLFRAGVGTSFGRAALTYLSGLPRAQLEERVRRLPPGSIIYYVSVSADGSGDRFFPVDVVNRLSEIASAPVYSWHEGMLGHGIVGGRLHSSIRDMEETARVALQVLGGRKPATIPITRIDAHVLRYDWRQLRRWKIPEDRVPAGSTVLFRQSSFWEQYRGYLIAGIAIFSGQLALIVGLIAQRVWRRRAEAKWRNNEQLYRSVVDTQSELICRFLPDSTLTFVNDAYCRFGGKTREELLGTKFTEMIPAASRGAVLERIGRIRRGMDSHEHEVLLPDGSVGWHHWINHAIVDERGTLVEFQGVGRDITDRIRAEEALRVAEERNSAMLRAVPDLMFVILRDGTYVDYHARDPKALFEPPGVFIGKKVREIMPPAVSRLLMDALERTFQSDETIVVEFELAMGESRYYREARLVRAGGDRVLVIVRDQTQAKRALALNRDLAGRLIASQEAERQRIARELHDDLSQKMAVLTMDIDLLARSFAAEQPTLSALSEQAREIALDIQHLSHELHPSKLRSLGLDAAIESLCRDIGRHSRVHIAFTHGILPPAVDADVSLCLYRIAQEALHNIARHSKAREAEVQLRADADALILQIADSGVGFNPQAEHAGLGLVSIRERVALLKGRAVIHASPGRGTRIGVRVPLSQSSVESPASEARSD